MTDAYKIIVDNVSKAYKMYNTPTDRLKEALSISGRSKHTDFFALSNVSFKVKKGEILGIMGRNGAGKSTLLKIITGVLNPTYGSVQTTGRISSLLELGAGFNFEYSGIENIYFYGTIMGLTKAQINEKVDDIINFSEIGDYVHQPVKTYSSGMFARLAFSCAINVDPDILIVDEILSVGDMRFQSKCFNKFKEFKNKGVTILYVGHDVSLMRSFCDTAIWLNNGKIVAEGDPTFISAKYVEFMYLDDISNFTTYKKFDNCLNGTGKSSVKSEQNESTIGKTIEQVKNDDRFPRCLSHWGTCVGLVENVCLLDTNNQNVLTCAPEDKIRIKVLIKNYEDIDYEYFSVAVSIKNKEGTDLIVKATYDEKIRFEKEHKLTAIEFVLKPMLAVGEYYLVVALEDRKNTAIMYYEYIEGAKFFKVYTDKKIFGVFDPDVKINLECGE
jgi:ABC-type polysaccharide/polyol phosphate transport system ATPase subunit